MPTGYTAAIYDDISFEDFILNCARNFGALMHMRDDSSKAKIKLRKETDYYQESLEESEAELEELLSLDGEGAFKRARAANTERFNEYLRRVTETQKQLSQLVAMREKVESWQAPSEEHTGLKKFMLSQIDETISFDCYTQDAPKSIGPAEWLSSEIDCAKSSVEYSRKQLAKSKERNKETNKWIEQLFHSIGREDEFKKLQSVSW